MYDNKKVKTQAVTKQELPRFPAQENPVYLTDSLKRIKQKSVWHGRFFSQQNFVLSSYQTFKFAELFVWCGNWSFVVRLCWTNVSQKCRRSRQLHHFTWHCRYIPNPGSDPECQGQKERNLCPRQKMNFTSCKHCTRMGLLLVGLCALWQKLAIYQYQRSDNFAIQDFAHQIYSTKKLCKTGKIKIYSTKGKSKAAFAERKKRSLKNIKDPHNH